MAEEKKLNGSKLGDEWMKELTGEIEYNYFWKNTLNSQCYKTNIKKTENDPDKINPKKINGTSKAIKTKSTVEVIF